MNHENIERLKHFIDTAIERGWTPCNDRIEDTFIVLDPPCVRIAVASPTKLVDNDVYVDWLSPLHDKSLAYSVWGEKLVASSKQPIPDHQVAWRYHQHCLLDLLQTAGVEAYFEYLELTM
jgi:hypothetical protein